MITAKQKRVLLPAVLFLIAMVLFASLLGTWWAVAMVPVMAGLGGWLAFGLFTGYGEAFYDWLSRDGWR